MPRVPLFGQSAEDADNTWANTSRLVNLYREPAGDGEWMLKGVLGQTLLTSLPDVFTRAAEVIDGRLYVVHGGALWRVSADGTYLRLGTVQDSAETGISGNNGSVTVAAGGEFYLWNGGAVQNVGGGAFTEVGDVAFLGQRTIAIERGGRKVMWSAPADPLSFDALDFASTESRDDTNLRALVVAGLLWIFKTDSIERWADTSTGPQYVPGSTIEIGLKSWRLATTFPDGAFFIGNDNRAYIAGAQGLQPVSNVAVETAIVQGVPANLFHYKDEGHDFLVLTFQDRPAWVYDFATREWHERSGGAGGAWRMTAGVYAYGKAMIADANGNIWQLERTNYDGNTPIIKTATSRTVDFGGERRRIAEIRFRARVGRTARNGQQLPQVLGDGDDEAIVADDGAIELSTAQDIPDHVVELSWSHDNGHNWSKPRAMPLGDVGEFQTQLIQRALGQFRQVTFRLSWAGPFEATVSAAADVRLA